MYVCHCGTNIAGKVDVDAVAEVRAKAARSALARRATTSSCAPIPARS
ncbi:MAG: hypothetical protein MZU95_00550 [Desulfomicrobium escambiense]|nr:hypothetical protein [Desulfomicrobium escambiense]